MMPKLSGMLIYSLEITILICYFPPQKMPAAFKCVCTHTHIDQITD